MADRYEEIAALVDRLRHAHVDRALCYDAAEMIAALRHQDTWHEIDDPEHPAPRDGTAVILAASNARTDTVIVGEAYFNAHDDDCDRGWWWAGTSPGEYHGSSLWELNHHPTHWRPLPAPPPQSVRQDG